MVRGIAKKVFFGPEIKLLYFMSNLNSNKKKSYYGIPIYISWCISLKKLNIKFFATLFLEDSSSCQLQKCA